MTLGSNACTTGELLPNSSYISPFVPHLEDNNDKNPTAVSMGNSINFL